MRMRKKPNLASRMKKCEELLVKDCLENAGKWRNVFCADKDIWLEIGCGKGNFTVETAKSNEGISLAALEKVEDAMVVAMERAENAELGNVRFISEDAVNLGAMFEKGEINRLFINFCDPWPKSRDAKYRLTAPRFLRIYSDILTAGGEIHFKTDNLPLFEWSLKQFEAEGWTLSNVIYDLHKDGPAEIMTDYESKFHSAGNPIYKLVAVKNANTLTTAAGEPERLRNASLTDARGYEESVAANKEAER